MAKYVDIAPLPGLIYNGVFGDDEPDWDLLWKCDDEHLAWGPPSAPHCHGFTPCPPAWFEFMEEQRMREEEHRTREAWYV